MTDAILAHLHSMETAARERHAEVLRRIAEVEDAAQCASVDITEVRSTLRRILEDD